jgi:hypothetical protein
MKRADYAVLVGLQGHDESGNKHDKRTVGSQLRVTYYLKEQRFGI